MPSYDAVATATITEAMIAIVITIGNRTKHVDGKESTAGSGLKERMSAKRKRRGRTDGHV